MFLRAIRVNIAPGSFSAVSTATVPRGSSISSFVSTRIPAYESLETRVALYFPSMLLTFDVRQFDADEQRRDAMTLRFFSIVVRFGGMTLFYDVRHGA